MDQNWNNANGQAPAGGAAAMPNPSMPNPSMPNQPLPPVNPAMGVPTAPMAIERKGSVVETIILVIVCLIAAAAIVVAVIFFMQWRDLKTDADFKTNEAVAAAVKETQETDNARFAEEQKEPRQQFCGPADYGSVCFYYPKTWSVYIEADARNNSDFKAYFAPKQVNPIKESDSRYALRFTIYNKQYEDVAKTYQRKVEKGEMTYRTWNSDNNKMTGALYEGQIDKQIRGMVLLIKVNDKTVLLQADADTFRSDFEALITTLRRNS